ncbi:MAG TPA: alanine dehydrogenase, partial [Bacteroidetes bacterium]|nr:alanine dehydrogenase [Bacteroidota bacterium]
MEIPSIQGLQAEVGLLPLEKEREVSEAKRRLRIGVPSEEPNCERRVALAPYAVALLTGAGHEVRIESGAGEAAQFSDHDYAEAGAEVVEGAGQVFGESDLVVKVFPPREEELAMMKERQVLVSALHLGNITPDL